MARKTILVILVILVIIGGNCIWSEDISGKEDLSFFEAPSRDSTKLIPWRGAVGGGVLLTSTTLAYMNMSEVWGPSTGKFHFKMDFWDDGLYLNDEVSHMIIGYKLTQMGISTARWIGFSERWSYWIGGGGAFLWMFTVEYPTDAYNPYQGFGISDFIVNNIGVTLALVRRNSSDFLKKFDFKLSYMDLSNYPETIVAWDYQDYNNFVYWLTYHPWHKKIPLNVGFGYSTQWRTGEKEELKPQYLVGLGISLGELEPLVGEKWGDRLDLFGFFNFNLHYSLN